MSEKETIPLLSIKKNIPVKSSHNSGSPPPPIQFLGYGRAASVWCGNIKNK